MKRVVIPIVFSLFLLAGCETTKIVTKTVTVTQYKYVIVKIPAEAIAIPEAPVVPDPETATDKDIAGFILEQEGFARKLIDRMTELAKYQVDAVQNLLKRGIKKEDIIE